MDRLIGKVLDNRYIIKEIIGTGGMSVVYKAEDTLEDRFVAIKVLKDEFISEPKFRHRFLNESRAIAMLSHENIVDVVDVNFEGEIQYIVMEHIDGITLKEYLNSKGALPVAEALGYTKQILRALRHAHERGVVHRDIKPQNIMLLGDSKIKVTDFGIAHVSNFETVTMSEMAIGSVHYISPEQAKGMPTDEKSDLYSTGIMLYEMVTGRLPFEGDTAVSVALMQVQQEPAKPSTYVPDLPIGIEQIILKAMQKKVIYRYQNAQEMIDDIEAFEEDPEIVFSHSYETNLDEGTKIMNRVKIDDTPEQRKKLLWKNRIFALCAGAASALILLTVGAILLFTLGSDDSNLFEIPDLVGKYAANVKEDISVIKYFTITEMEAYDENVSQGYVISQSPPAGKKYEQGKEITITVSKGREMTTVPQILNMTAKQAQSMLETFGLIYGTTTYQPSNDVKDGFIISSDPEPGTAVASGTTVNVVVCKLEQATTTLVPDVSGKSEDEARNAIEASGLKVDVKPIYNNNYAEGVAISTDPEAGIEIDVGDAVTLYISKGSTPSVSVPSGLIGKTEEEVTDILQSLDLKVTSVEHTGTSYTPGTVYSVSPEEGAIVMPGSTVTISVASAASETPPSDSGDENPQLPIETE